MKILAFIAMILAATAAIAGQFSESKYEAARQYITEMSQDRATTLVTGDISKRKIYFADLC